MKKIGQKLAAVLLAVVMVITFMPVLGNMTGLKIGVQTVYAMSFFAPNINPQRRTISLKVDNPYAGKGAGCIGSWEEELDEDTGTKITVMDMWIDPENGPMNDESKFEEGKKYKYQAYVSSSTDTGTAPDLSTWSFGVGKVNSEDEINWPDGTVTCEKTESKILYTAEFTAKAAPSRDMGTYKLNLVNGKVKLSDEAARRTFVAVSYDYPKRSSEAGYDIDVDLDHDGAYDIGLYFHELVDIECGKLSTTKIKNSITVKISDAAKRIYDANEYDYYGALTVQFEKLTNPLSVKPKTAIVKYSKLKKKNQTLAVTKVIKFTKKGQGKLTYKLVSAKKGKKSYKKYFKINKTNGKLTVKKNSKMKKGIYKVKMKVTAAGNADYKKATKTVTVKIKVK